MANPILTVAANQKVSGWLREINLAHNTCQIYADGEAINCSFDPSLKQALIDALDRRITAYGEAIMQNGNGHGPKVKEIYVRLLEPGNEDVEEPGSAGYSPTQALIDAGAIRPLPGSEEIGDSVAYIRKLREDNYR